jgi:(2Fe-2S) ferredoxin
VRLSELEEEAKGSKVGMDKDEVLRALKFLHAAGSVLYYGSDTHRSSPWLQNMVFMQPQFIIDAISYVIREPSAKNVNDKVRGNDERIRNLSSAEGEALWELMKRRLKAESVPAMRTKAACLRVCTGGPWLVVYPEGIWYGSVTAERFEGILQQHLRDGRPVLEWVSGQTGCPLPHSTNP